MTKSAQAPRNAVIFRTHFWDDFAERQFERLQPHTAGCDVFILVDETAGPVAIPHENVVSVTESSLLALGLARAGQGNLLWFNGDYPLYAFHSQHPDYDSYFQLEYDVALNTDIAPLLARMRAAKVDFIGLTKGEPAQQWPFLESCAGLYDTDTLRHELICLSAFSGPALAYLFGRRLEHARLRATGILTAWPMCEAFIATELAQGGFLMAELSDFGATSEYDHWPPYLESDLPLLTKSEFIHPVLDEPRYVASLLKYHIGVTGYLKPTSLFHRKLRRLPRHVYWRALASTFLSKALRNIRLGTFSHIVRNKEA
jgi:hypothetical protein